MTGVLPSQRRGEQNQPDGNVQPAHSEIHGPSFLRRERRLAIYFLIGQHTKDPSVFRYPSGISNSAGSWGLNWTFWYSVDQSPASPCVFTTIPSNSLASHSMLVKV